MLIYVHDTRGSSHQNRDCWRKHCTEMKIPAGVIHCTTCSSSVSNIAAVLVFFRLLIIAVNGFSNVIPISDCSPMESIHGVPPQLGNPPFFTYTDKQVVTNNNGDAVQLRLTIKQRSLGEETAFKGYLVMAFDDVSANNDSIGSFFQPSDGQVVSCSSGTSNVVTHKSSEDKQFVTVYWTPPEGFVGSVTFRTTYLKNGTVFWINSSTAYPVRVVNAITTTISTSTSTEFIPLTTSLTTNVSYSDSTNDENATITSTTETLFNTTEEDDSTSISTTDKATTTTKSPFSTNKPSNGGTSSEIPLDCHVLLLASLTCCWTVLFCLNDKFLLPYFDF